MPPVRKRPRPPAREPFTRLAPDTRRAQIMFEAERLFATRPNADFGVGEVAQGAGVTPGLVYHYFESKEGLLAAVCDLRARELLQASLADSSLAPIEQVERGVKGYMDFVEAHRLVYLNLFKSPAAIHPEIVRICEDTRQAIVEHFVVSLGLAKKKVPALRVALRGHLGYSESVILRWLEEQTVPRTVIEQLSFANIGSALESGLRIDGAMPAAQIEQLMQAYRSYFVPA